MRAVTGVAATDLLTTRDEAGGAVSHGFRVGDPVVFEAKTGGTGITLEQTYYVIASGLTSSAFRVSATLGGATIDFSADLTAGRIRERPGAGVRYRRALG